MKRRGLRSALSIFGQGWPRRFVVAVAVAAVAALLLAVASRLGAPRSLTQNPNRTPAVEEGGAASSTFNPKVTSYMLRSKQGDLAVSPKHVWVANGGGIVRIDKATGEEEAITVADGLAEGGVSMIAYWNDEVWALSTAVNRIDPSSLSVHVDTAASGLPTTTIQNATVLLGDGNYLWVGTGNNGIAQYDRRTRRWNTWQSVLGKRFTHVRQIVANDDYTWIMISPSQLTRGGVFRYDKRRDIWEDQQSDTTLFVQSGSWGSAGYRNDFNAIISLEDGKLVTRGENGPTFRYDPLTNTWEQKPRDNADRQYAAQYGDTIVRWHGIYASSVNGEVRRDLLLENAKTHATRTLDVSPLLKRCRTYESGRMNYGWQSFTYAKPAPHDGLKLWFGCPQGVAAYDLATERWKFLGDWPDYPSTVSSLYIARGNDLLVSTNLGIGLLNPAEHSWKLISDKLLPGYTSNHLWIGDDIYIRNEGNILRYRVSTGKLEVKQVDASSLLGAHEVLAQDGDGVWLVAPSSTDSGRVDLVWVDRATLTPKRYTVPADTAASTELILDGAVAGGKLWFTTWEKGLASLDPTTGTFSTYPQPPRSEMKMISRDAVGMATDGKTLWINAFGRHTDQRIFAFDTQSQRWADFSKRHPELRSSEYGVFRQLEVAGERLVILSHYAGRGEDTVDAFSTADGSRLALPAEIGKIPSGQRKFISLDQDGKHIWLWSPLNLERVELGS